MHQLEIVESSAWQTKPSLHGSSSLKIPVLKKIYGPRKSQKRTSFDRFGRIMSGAPQPGSLSEKISNYLSCLNGFTWCSTVQNRRPRAPFSLVKPDLPISPTLSTCHFLAPQSQYKSTTSIFELFYCIPIFLYLG